MLSPFEMLFGNPPDLHHLKVFRCACYPFPKHKLEPKITQHIFLGYPHNFKGYIYYNSSTKKTIVSRHVIFHETIFPFAQSSSSSSSQTQSLSNPILLLTLPNLPHHTSSHFIFIHSSASTPLPLLTIFAHLLWILMPLVSLCMFHLLLI